MWWAEEILHYLGWKPINNGINLSTGAGFRNHPQYVQILSGQEIFDSFQKCLGLIRLQQKKQKPSVCVIRKTSPNDPFSMFFLLQGGAPTVMCDGL